MDRNIASHEGLENLLELDGWTIQQAGGYWVKFEVRIVKAAKHIPHGIKYSLTLHDCYNQRVMGFDNAHAPKQKTKKFSGRIVYHDHQHIDIDCRGILYQFQSPEQLMVDFWQAVDDYLTKAGDIIMRKIRVGIMPQDKIRAMTIAIAKGEIKPGRSTPTIWFPSMKAMSEVLSDHNRELLQVMAEKKPQSIKALAEMTGRKPNNVSRTIETMRQYGLVEVKRIRQQVIPIAKGTEFLIEAS